MRWLWALPALTLGAGVALAGVLVHRHAVWVDGWPLPWGGLLAVAAATALALRLLGHAPALMGFVVGWVLVLTWALSDGPGGDFVLLSDVLGWGFLGVSVVLAAAVLGLQVVAHRRREERSTA